MLSEMDAIRRDSGHHHWVGFSICSLNCSFNSGNRSGAVMSEIQGGFTTFHGTVPGTDASTPACSATSPIEPAPPGEATAIVIVCELRSESDRRLSFDLTEHVEFATGARVVVRTDRGWGGGGSNRSGDPWRGKTEESLESTALDLWDCYREEERGLSWVIPVLAAAGVQAEVDHIESLPVVVELSPDIHERLQAMS